MPMKFLPRLRSARLAAELAEVRDRAERAEARIDEVFAEMERQTAAAGLPRRRPARHLSLVGRDDRPGAA